jgi:hypothetical protein
MTKRSTVKVENYGFNFQVRHGEWNPILRNDYRRYFTSKSAAMAHAAEVAAKINGTVEDRTE